MANFAFAGISASIGGESYSSDFASGMQAGFGQFIVGLQYSVGSFQFSEVLASDYGDVSGVQFAAFVSCLVAVMGALLLGTKLKKEWFPAKDEGKAVKLSPLPLPVEITRQMATKEELREAEADIEKRFDRLEETQEQQRVAARMAIRNVHKRIDKVVENTSEIKGELKQVNENLGRLVERSMK
ncbi:hypothetical protein ACFSQZ_03170 [Rubritalea spongiae]|uniref:MFS transporter n=1 Tax=Rubritalea spongiae TaxID=430797 RepID=A0ABW5E0Q8_9BACT